MGKNELIMFSLHGGGGQGNMGMGDWVKGRSGEGEKSSI